MSDEISKMQERIAKLKAKQEAQKRLDERDVKLKSKPETAVSYTHLRAHETS